MHDGVCSGTVFEDLVFVSQRI